MSFDELIDRLRDRFLSYWRSEKRSIKFMSRFLALTLFGAVLSTIAPTLADELSTDPTMLETVAQSQPAPVTSTVTISETPTATPSADAIASPSPAESVQPVRAASPAPQATEAPVTESSESATVEAAAEPFKIQPRYIVKAPPSGAIDPRAAAYFLPHIFASQDDPEVTYTMICVRGSAGMVFDAIQKGAGNNSIGEDERIFGDRSGYLVISAETARAVALLNSYAGLFISTTGGGLTGRSLALDFVAVTKPVADPAFCGAARSGAVITLRPLGLDLSTVKGGGKLK
jgi:hypothetical protein